MIYRLFLVSKRNSIEKTERVMQVKDAARALEIAAEHYFNWTVKGIEPCV